MREWRALSHALRSVTASPGRCWLGSGRDDLCQSQRIKLAGGGMWGRWREEKRVDWLGRTLCQRRQGHQDQQLVFDGARSSVMAPDPAGHTSWVGTLPSTAMATKNGIFFGL